MMIVERIQALIHKLEVDAGARWLNYLALALVVVALGFWYDMRCYRDFSSPEAMDAAQVARNLAAGNGFTTEFIRPFSICLIQQHNPARNTGSNLVDSAEVYGRHPDLANAPLYPLALAGLFKLTSPDWTVETSRPFWSDNGFFVRYKPEFLVAIFNQILLLAAVVLTFLLARGLFDATAGWLAAGLMLGSDALWKFSVSGLPTMLLLVIFLGLVRCLASFAGAGAGENPDARRRLLLAAVVGLLAGLGMLTRYSFGWVMLPVTVFFILFGGPRRAVLAATAGAVFVGIVSPWIIRNLAVSGTLFGTAGYAVAENTSAFPGSRLMQSLTPDFRAASVYRLLPYASKLVVNLRSLLEGGVLRLGGGWMGALFFAGLLLGLRTVAGRRLRYFTMMCLGVFLVAAALGRTEFSVLAPELNAETLLVLLTPLVLVFGVAFFLTLLNQMNVPSVETRYGVIVLVVVVACQPFIMTLLLPGSSPRAFPPYYPPDIQKFSSGLRPDELVMSDMPWAVAWYGNRQCVWNTLDSQDDYFAFNDNVKHVDGLYLSFLTLNSQLYSDCMEGAADSWPKFALRTVVTRKSPPEFPLKLTPYSLSSGVFLTDHAPWPAK